MCGVLQKKEILSILNNVLYEIYLNCIIMYLHHALNA